MKRILDINYFPKELMFEPFDINYFPKELMSVPFDINCFPNELMSVLFGINYFPKELMSMLFGINYFPKELIFVTFDVNCFPKELISVNGFLPRMLAIVVNRVKICAKTKETQEILDSLGILECLRRLWGESGGLGKSRRSRKKKRKP